MRRSAWLVIVLALGCHRLGESDGEAGGDSSGDSDEDPIVACGGLLTRTPVVVAETIAYAPDVIVDGDTLVLVEPGQYGALRRLDRCSGAELASRSVPFLDRAIIHQGAVVLTGILEGPITYLERWNEDADKLEFLSEAPFSRLYSHSTGLYLAAKEEVFRFDEGSASLELVLTIDTFGIEGLAVSHIGISDAGLYFRRDYDCGCTPTLSRWSIAANETTGVLGSAGARRLAALGERIFVNVDQNPNGFGSGIDDIVELPAAGGEPKLLFSGNLDDGPVQAIAANDEWVCWTNFTRAPRCVRHDDPSELLEIEYSGEGVHGRLALAEDALYWFVQQNGESRLMAAAL